MKNQQVTDQNRIEKHNKMKRTCKNTRKKIDRFEPKDLRASKRIKTTANPQLDEINEINKKTPTNHRFRIYIDEKK